MERRVDAGSDGAGELSELWLLQRAKGVANVLPVAAEDIEAERVDEKLVLLALDQLAATEAMRVDRIPRDPNSLSRPAA